MFVYCFQQKCHLVRLLSRVSIVRLLSRWEYLVVVSNCHFYDSFIEKLTGRPISVYPVERIAWWWPELSQNTCPLSIYNNLRQKSAEHLSIFDKNWSIERVLKNFTSFSWFLPHLVLDTSVFFSFCLMKMILRRYFNIVLLLRFIFIKKSVKTPQIFK